MDKLLTKNELAERWRVAPITIDRWVDAGVISPVKGLPSIRFSMAHVLKIEGVEISRLSPFERKRLEREVGELKEINKKLEDANRELKGYVESIMQQGFKFIKVISD